MAHRSETIRPEQVRFAQAESVEKQLTFLVAWSITKSPEYAQLSALLELVNQASSWFVLSDNEWICLYLYIREQDPSEGRDIQVELSR